MSEENIAIARQVTKAQNEMDAEKLRQLLSPDFFAHISDEYLDREQFIKGVLMSHHAFSDLTFTIEDIFGEGEKVALRIKAKGRHTGYYRGIPATHREVSFAGITIRHIEKGQVYKEWQVNDQEHLLEQLKPERGEEPETSNFAELVWDRIINVGRAVEKINDLLNQEIFRDLSKHNPKWESEHEKENDTLYDARCALKYTHNQLEDIYYLLKNTE